MSLLKVDRAYTNLLSHLQGPRSSISLETVLSTIPHYLAQLALPHPTQFTAFVISSSLWHPLSIHTVDSIVNAYRSAVHLKVKNLQNSAGHAEAHSASRAWGPLLAEWTSAVMKGVSRGNPQLRIAILGGLLFGFSDLGDDSPRIWVQDRLENQVVIACAEMLEAFTMTGDSWKTDSRAPGNEDVGDGFTLFLYSAYNILPLVATKRITALDLLTLARLAIKGMEAAFSSGKFLSQLSPSITWDYDGKLVILPESSLMLSLQAINNFTLYKDAGHLARLLSRCISLIADQNIHAAWQTFQDVSRELQAIALNVEKDWKESPLATLTSEEDLEQGTRTLSTDIWKVLKTLLFSQLVAFQAILSSIQYLPPLVNDLDLGPSSIACSILLSLHHLSFVISQFGGVASSATGFKELKQVFYMALDIVAADPDPQTCPTFVKELLSRAQESCFDSAHPFRQSQTAHVLVVVEQLMPTLNDLMIEKMIVPFCYSYLTNPDHRETYESSHSVILSIFTAHSQHKPTTGLMNKPSLVERLVPFYIDLLLQDFGKNRLNTSQLRTAYSNLARSAASSGDNAISWLCIDALLEALASHSSPSNLIPLSLVLVSLVSCVPLSLLSRLLSEVESVLGRVDHTDKAELGKAIVEEITHKVGDREKETVLSWWGRVDPDSIRSQEVAT